MATEEANTVQARSWAWDHYWRDGRLASCGGEGGVGYGDVIARGWHEFFTGLAQASRILDVCSGNGAIARLAERVALDRGIRFSIDAADAAQLVPPGIAGNAMIRFRSRVAAEDLPYAAESFDVVVAQYGIEYTDLDRSLPELARVSSTDCRLRFLIHASEGVVVGGARNQLAEIAQLRNTGIFAAASAVAKAQGQPASSQASIRVVQRDYQFAVEQLARAATSSVEPQMFTNTVQVFNHALSVQAQVGMQTILDKIAEVNDSITAHSLRLVAMTQAAMDEHGAKDLAARIGELWRQKLHVVACVRADGALLGWAIERSAA